MVDVFDAPIAKHDLDEFGDFQSIENYSSNLNESDFINDNKCFPDLSPLHDASMHASLENLVSNFDETISKCFNASDEKLDSLSPIYGSTPETAIFDKSQLWYKITGNFANSTPLDWSKSRIFHLQTAALHLVEKEDVENQNLDLPDDDELIAAFDHHSLITPRLPDGMDPIKSADEIIDEIDQIMFEDDLDTPTDANTNFAQDCDAILFRCERISRPDNWEEELEKMSIRQLNEYLEDLECSIRDYSATLVQQLASREELDFEKEQKDVFVSLVHSIHKRLEARGLPSSLHSSSHGGQSCNGPASGQQKGSRGRGKNTEKQRSKHGGGRGSIVTQDTMANLNADKDGQFLTTTIPYHQASCPPGVELLQTFNDILSAMLSNNPQVSTLLTDYILNLYVPADKLSPPALP